MTRRGEPVQLNWTAGGGKQVRRGDRVFLGRQGDGSKGVIASGAAVSDWQPGEHWGDPSKTTTLNEIAFDTILPPDAVLPRAELLTGPLARVLWGAQKSGIRIPDDAAAALEVKWRKYLEKIGFADSGETAAVELYGVEGQLKARIHYQRERRPELIAALKAQTLAERGHLQCEVCEFDFAEFYGEHGDGFMEGHHRVPLSQVDPAKGKTVRITDLGLVCANCHRMLHRGDWPSIEELRQRIRPRRERASA